MSKLNIDGYKKLEGISVNNWKCAITSSTDYSYTFLFDYMVDLDTTYGMGFFNLITINRMYQNPMGFKVEVDFNIVHPDSGVQQFKNVDTVWVYAHNLITLDKFKEIISPLLQIRQH